MIGKVKETFPVPFDKDNLFLYKEKAMSSEALLITYYNLKRQIPK